MIGTPSTGLSSKRGTYHSHQLRVKSFWLNMLLEGVKLFDKEERRNKKKRVNIDTRSSIFIIN